MSGPRAAVIGGSLSQRERESHARVALKGPGYAGVRLLEAGECLTERAPFAGLHLVDGQLLLHVAHTVESLRTDGSLSVFLCLGVIDWLPMTRRMSALGVEILEKKGHACMHCIYGAELAP